MALPQKRIKLDANGEDVKLKEFLKWLNDSNFSLSSKVTVSRAGSCAQYGLVAVENISEDEVLFTIPRAMLLCPDTSAISDILNKEKADLQCSSGWVPLLISLMYESRNPDSKWKPYLDLVPDFTQLDHPMFWERTELEKELKGTGILQSVDEDIQKMSKEFEEVVLPFFDKHPDIFSKKYKDFEFYKRMVGFVMAYSFTEPPPQQDESTDSEGEEDVPSNPPMMVPMADILNHVAKNNARLKFGEDTLTMVSTQDIEQGSEIYNTYGELSNSDLLHMYGFAERYPENLYDTVDIPHSVFYTECSKLAADKDLWKKKWDYLKELGVVSDGGSFVFGNEGFMTSDELSTAISIFLMSAEEFTARSSDEWEEENEEDLTTEGIEKLPSTWKGIINRTSKACLDLYSSSDDEALFSSDQLDDLPRRQKWSLYVRYGQKKLLTKLISLCS